MVKRAVALTTGLFSLAFAQEGVNPLCPALQTLADYLPMLQLIGVTGIAVIILVISIGAFISEKYRHGLVVLIVGAILTIALWVLLEQAKPRIESAVQRCSGGISAVQVWKS